MPLIKDEQPWEYPLDQARVFGSTDSEKAKEPEPTLTELVGQAFERTGIGGLASSQRSFADRIKSTFNYYPDKEFNPIQYGTGNGYEEFSDLLLEAQNEQDYNAIIADIDRSRKINDTMSRGGGWSVLATLAAEAANPINYLPLAGYKRGLSFLDNMARIGMTGAVSAVANEAMMQSADPLRTAQDAAFNIGVTAFATGLIGAAAPKMGIAAKTAYFNKTFPQVEAQLIKDFGPEATQQSKEFALAHITGDQEKMRSMVGAMPNQFLGEMLVKSDLFNLDLGKLLAFTTPQGRAFRLGDERVASLWTDMFDVNLLQQKNFAGEATSQSVELLAQIEYNKIAILHDDLRKLYLEGAKKGAFTNYEKFDEDVIINRRLVKAGKISMDSLPDEMQKAVSLVDDLFNKYRTDLSKYGQRTIDNYTTAMFDPTKIMANRDDFVQKIIDKFKKTIVPNAIARLEQKAAMGIDDVDYERLFNRTVADDTFLAKATDSDFYTQAEILSDKIEIGDYAIRLDNEISGVRKKDQLIFNKREFFDSVETEIDFQDYLFNKASGLTYTYVRNVAPDIKILEKFGSFDEFEKRVNDALGLRSTAVAGLPDNVTPAQRAKQAKRLETTRKDFNLLMSRLRGTTFRDYKVGSEMMTAINFAKAFSEAVHLGFVVPNSAAEIGMTVFRHGISTAFGKQTRTLIKNLTNKKFMQAMTKESRELGASIEFELSRMHAMINNVDDASPVASRMNKAIGNARRYFFLGNGLTQFTQMSRRIAQNTTNARIVKLLKQHTNGTLSNGDRAYLANLGIGNKNIDDIAEQALRHGNEFEGVFFSNVDDWDNQALAATYRYAVLKDVNMVNVKASFGEAPTSMYFNPSIGGSLGQVFWQLKSFMFAATQKILLSGLQRKDSAVLSGLMAMVTLGMASYYVGEISKGREPSDDIEDWIYNGIDKSGSLGIITEVASILQLPKAIGVQNFSAREDLTGLQRIAGPTFGLIDPVYKIGTIVPDVIAGEDITKDEIYALKRVTPFASHPVVRLFERLSE